MPNRNGTTLAAAKPTKARAGRRSHARSANHPATNAEKMKPMTKPKLGLATAASEPVRPAKIGQAGEPEEHVGRERGGAAPRAERGAHDDHAQRLAR